MYKVSDIKELYFETLDSTQIYILENSNELDNLTFVRCKNQTNGHGRMNRCWKSDNDLTFSFLIKDEYILKRFYSLSLLLSLSIHDALNEIGIKDSLIKWPNDVYVDNKKICGIILESTSIDSLDFISVGIGLNVNSINFDNLNATSLKLITNTNYDIELVKDIVYEKIIESLNSFKFDEHYYIDFINKYNYLYGKTVYIYPNYNKTKGVAGKINLNNSLEVIVDDNKVEVSSDEVFILV